jgi:hypothetical protein
MWDVQRGTVVSVQFQADDKRGDWNVELHDPRNGKPITAVPDRALDHAVFAANNLHDLQPFYDLQQFRAVRAEAVERHFMICARKLIDQIEGAEGWEEWLPRMAQKEDQ